MQAYREPIFTNMPGVVLGVVAVITAVSGLALLMGGPLYEVMVTITAASPASARSISIYGEPWMRPFDGLFGYVLHVFSHGDWIHLLGNMGMTLALGAPLGRRLGATRRGVIAFLLLFFVSAIVGAITHVTVYSLFGGRVTPIIGASTGVSGLLAAAMYIWRTGPNAPLPSINSETYLTAISPWILLNMAPLVLVTLAPQVFGILAGIAWVSHLGGIAAGAVLFPLLDRWANPQPRSLDWRH